MSRREKVDGEPLLVSELRASIAECGATPFRLAEKAGMDESMIRKFTGRTRSLSLVSGALLVEALGMRILRPLKPRKFPGRTRSRARAITSESPDLAEVLPIQPGPVSTCESGDDAISMIKPDPIESGLN